MNDEYITLSEAARRAGYSSTSTLRAAALKGRLKSRRFGPRAIMTTHDWLGEYLASLGLNRRFRGKPKGMAGDQVDA